MRAFAFNANTYKRWEIQCCFFFFTRWCYISNRLNRIYWRWMLIYFKHTLTLVRYRSRFLWLLFFFPFFLLILRSSSDSVDGILVESHVTLTVCELYCCCFYFISFVSCCFRWAFFFVVCLDSPIGCGKRLAKLDSVFLLFSVRKTRNIYQIEAFVIRYLVDVIRQQAPTTRRMSWVPWMWIFRRFFKLSR